jgi:hypothetical protein
VTPEQPVRLVDHRTNQVVFEGTGYDAARKATEIGQGLTDTLGRKANYSIQTADPTGAYNTVAYEKKNKSTLGTIGDIVGTALPIAVSLIPGLQFLGPVASAALAGGAGAALKGDNILKGVAMGGLSAAGGQVLGPALGAGGTLGTNLAPKLATAIGTGLGSTAGGLVTGQSLKNSLLGGVASGALSYVAPDIQRELGISPKSGSIFRGGDTAASIGGADSSAAYGGPNAEIVVNAPAFSTPNIKLGGFKTPAQKYLDDAANTDVTNPLTQTDYASGYDGDLINVTGSVPGAVTGGLNLAGFTGNPAVDQLIQPETSELGDEDIIKVTGQRPGAVTGGLNLGALTTTTPTVSPNDIVVTATETQQPTGGLTVAQNPVVDGVDTVTKEIVATAPKSEPVTGGLTVAQNPVVDGVDQVTKEIVATAKKAEPVTGGLTVAQNPVVDGVDQVTKEIVATAPKTEPVTGGFTLSDTVLKDIDTKSAEEKAKEEEEKKKKLGVEEYLRLAALAAGLLGGGGGKGQTGYYGGGGSGRLNPIFSAKLPAAGGLGTIGAARTQRQLGDVDWLTYGTRPELRFFDYAQPTPVPVTTPVPNDPAAPAMYVPDDNTFARGGGAFAAKRGGPSRRTEFAVNGPGTGRSDDIPAVLSDGEYVIDAETVALLGDGSSRAGAKKLDELRVKIRKHKGQKLAKGRFSANAKRPEAYLSGGRV